MTADKQKKRHVIAPPTTEEHVTNSATPEILPGTVENSSPHIRQKKNRKWTPEFINVSLEKVKALFPLLRAEEDGSAQ